jgi:hypothetical protein
MRIFKLQQDLNTAYVLDRGLDTVDVVVVKPGRLATVESWESQRNILDRHPYMELSGSEIAAVTLLAKAHKALLLHSLQ